MSKDEQGKKYKGTILIYGKERAKYSIPNPGKQHKKLSNRKHGYIYATNK